MARQSLSELLTLGAGERIEVILLSRSSISTNSDIEKNIAALFEHNFLVFLHMQKNIAANCLNILILFSYYIIYGPFMAYYTGPEILLATRWKYDIRASSEVYPAMNVVNLDETRVIY